MLFFSITATIIGQTKINPCQASKICTDYDFEVISTGNGENECNIVCAKIETKQFIKFNVTNFLGNQINTTLTLVPGACSLKGKYDTVELDLIPPNGFMEYGDPAIKACAWKRLV